MTEQEVDKLKEGDIIWHKYGDGKICSKVTDCYTVVRVMVYTDPSYELRAEDIISKVEKP